MLHFVGSRRVRHNLATERQQLPLCQDFHDGSAVKNLPANLGDVGLIPGCEISREEGNKWQSTPIFLPVKSHGQRSLVSYSPCCCCC